MRIELIQQEGKTVGWEIIAEDELERIILGSMRNVEFWGTGNDKIEYGGMTSYKPDDRYVNSLIYETKGYKKQQRQKFYEKIKNELKNK